MHSLNSKFLTNIEVFIAVFIGEYFISQSCMNFSSVSVLLLFHVNYTTGSAYRVIQKRGNVSFCFQKRNLGFVSVTVFCDKGVNVHNV